MTCITAACSVGFIPVLFGCYRAGSSQGEISILQSFKLALQGHLIKKIMNNEVNIREIRSTSQLTTQPSFNN